MTDSKSSVGKIQLDVEIIKSSTIREIEGFSKAFDSSFKRTFNSIGSQMTSFMKNTLGRMVGSYKEISRIGSDQSKATSQNISELKDKLKETEIQIEDTKDAIDRLTNAAEIGFTGINYTKPIDRHKMVLSELESAARDTRDEIERLEKFMDKSSETSEKLGSQTRKTSKDLKKLGDQSKKATGKVNTFTSAISRSFTTIIRRMFVYNLIYKALRGMINYMNASLKTNKEFVRSLNLIKTNLRVTFQPIYDFVLPALNSLMRGIATVTTYIASTISTLLGKTYQQSFGAAKGLDNAKKSMDGYGKSAKKTQGQLAGFDEVNQLDLNKDDEQSEVGKFEMTMPDTSTIDLTGLERFKDMLQPTIDSLKNLGLVLEPLKNFVSKGLQDFYKDVLEPVGNWMFGEGLPRFIDALAKGFSNINWQPINDGLKTLWASLTPFAINVGEGLLWFWENVLVPFGTWVWNETVPRLLKVLAGAFDVLSATIEVLKPLALWLWDNFLEPLAKWTGGAIIAILDGIAYAFENIADYIRGIQDVIENSDGFLDALVNVGIYLVEGLFKGVKSALSGIGKWLKENLVDPIVDWVKKLFGIASPSKVFMEIGTWLIEGLFRGISNTWVIITDYFSEKLDALKTIFTETWEGIKEKAVEIWTNINEFFIGTWSSTKENATLIWNSIKAFFIEIWTNIQSKTKEIWSSIKTFLIDEIWNPVKNTASTIFTAIENIVSSAFTAISTNIDKFSKSFKETWDKIWNDVKAVFSNVWSSITEVLPEFLGDMLNVMKDSFTDFKQVGHDMLNMVWEGMKGIWSSITGWVENTVDWLKDKLMFWKKGQAELGSGGGGTGPSGYEVVRDADGTFLGTNVDGKFEAAGSNPSRDWFNMDASQRNADIASRQQAAAAGVPMLARGGIVDQPTLAMIGENNKKEAVVPLENTAFVGTLASAIANAVLAALQFNNSNSSSSEGNGDTILQIDGITIARILGPIMDKEKQRIGSDLIIQTT